MTKEEAFQKLREGEKITHKYFLPHEYIYMKDGELMTEEDYYGTPEFWKLRAGPQWDNGWEIYK